MKTTTNENVEYSNAPAQHFEMTNAAVGILQNLRVHQDGQDAPCVAALLAAGAILLGKANLDEIGAGMTGVNPHHGAVRNPHNLARMTGGSSSGCAAIVACGICPFAIGELHVQSGSSFHEGSLALSAGSLRLLQCMKCVAACLAFDRPVLQQGCKFDPKGKGCSDHMTKHLQKLHWHYVTSCSEIGHAVI